MPRPRSKPGEIPQVQFYKPRNLACIYIEGKRHYLGPWGSPEVEENRQREWAEYLAQKKAHLGAGEKVAVAVLVDRFLEDAEEVYVKNGRQTGTYEQLTYAVQPLLELYARTPVGDFTPMSLKAIRTHMLERGWRPKFVNGTCGDRREYSREYINKRIDYIRQIFRWGVEHGLVRPETMIGLDAVTHLRKGRSKAVEKPDVQPVRDWVVEATMPFLPIGIYDMVRIQRLTGMRPGDVVSMRACDIFRHGDELPPGYELFPDLEELWLYIPAEHKTEHHDLIHFSVLGEECRKILTPYLMECTEEIDYIFSPAVLCRLRAAMKRNARKSKAQPSQQSRGLAPEERKRKPGEKYTSHSYWTAVQRAVDKRNKAELRVAEKEGRKPKLLPKWFPNQLRHAKATEIRRIADAEVAQVVMGHSRLQTTQIYAKAAVEKAFFAARKWG